MADGDDPRPPGGIPLRCGHHQEEVLRVSQRVGIAGYPKVACRWCWPELFEAVLECTHPELGVVLQHRTHPHDPHLWDIYKLLANGVNVALTLTKDDGGKFTYTIAEHLGDGADLVTNDKERP